VEQGVWIVKANNSSKGVGIKLLDRLSNFDDCKGILDPYRATLLIENRF
jgi:hypothetical protein